MSTTRFRMTSLRLLTCAGVVLVAALVVGCDVTPPGMVQNLIAEAGDAVVVLSWTNPTDSDLAGVKILRNVGSASSDITEGTLIFDGLETTHTDATAANGTEYFYAAFAYDRAGNLAAPAVASATPTSATAHAEILEALVELSAFIEEDPEDELSEEEKEVFQEILLEAELLYRGGDECGAADVLYSEFLVKAQDVFLRLPDTVETAEILYNEGRMLRYNMLSMIPIKSDCPGAERVGLEADADVEMENTRGLGVRSLFGEPLFQTVLEEEGMPGKLFTQIHIPGAEVLVGEAGVPGVPVFRRLVAAPRGADVSMLLMKAEPTVAEEIYMNLYPTQEEPVDQEDMPPPAPPDPSIFEDRPFVMNAEIYGTNEPFPPEPVTAVYVGSGRDIEYYLVEIATGQYQPLSKKLTLFEHVDVDLQFEGGTGAFITEGMLNPFEPNSSLYMESVLNKDFLGLYIEGRIKPTVTGEEFLILTHPDFSEAALALRDWKREKGIWTNVVECGTGSGITGRQTNTEIRSYIHNRWASVFIRPSYILLLGDSNFIAPFYLNNIGTDWPYAILGAIGVDKVPDFAVGRIPARTLNEANIMVNKVIDYERTPPFNANFYRHAAIAAQFQCCRPLARASAAETGTDQRTFIEVSEFARNVMVSAGKTVDRIYMATGTGGGAITPTRYYSGTLLPSPIGAASGFPWNGSTADILNAWNEGRFLIMHRDHGWIGGWEHPLFSWAHVPSLNNGNLLPVVFSVNCASGFFDNETAVVAQPSVAADYGVTATGQYWAERVLRRENGGAVGILGATRNSPSWANSTLTQGFFDAIWPNAIGSFGGNVSHRRLGDILNHAKLYLISKVGFSVMGQTISDSAAVNQLYLWHCLGDPTMEIWTHNPYLFILPVKLVYRPIGLSSVEKETFANGVNLEYDVDGSVITIYSSLRQTLTPIGRGVVNNGVATILFTEPHNLQLPLLFIAEAENAVAKILEAEKGN